MKLFSSATSPFVRKVLIVAHELDIHKTITLVPQKLNPTALDLNPEVGFHNPLAKIPTLHVEDVGPIFGSSVICQYLCSDAVATGPKTTKAHTLLSAESRERVRALTREALADGALDALLLVRYETAVRPATFQWDKWIFGQFAKADRALDALEQDAKEGNGLEWNVGGIAVVCLLGYLDFRFPDRDWRSSRPHLTAYYERSCQRESVSATQPCE